MKKVALSLIALLAVGSFAAAQTVAVTGSASVAYKYDLVGQVGLFTNTAAYTLAVPFKGDGSKKGTGDVYGQIDVTGGTVGISNATGVQTPTLDAATVAAKIVAGDLMVSFASAPGFGANYATYMAPLSVTNWADASTLSKAATTVGGGVTVGYNLHDFGTVNVGLATTAPVAAVTGASTITYTTKVATAVITVSAADATAKKYYDMAGLVIPAGTIAIGTMYVQAATATTTAVSAYKGGDYVAGLNAAIVAVKDLLSVNANAVYDVKTSTAGYGAQAIVKFAPVTVTAGYDAQGTASDLAANLAVAFAPITLGANYYMDLATAGRSQYGVTVAFAGGEMVPGLNASGYYKNLAQSSTDTSSTGAGGALDYTIAGIKVYGGADVDLTSSNMAYKAGVTSTALINNITLTAEYDAGLINTDAFGAAAITNADAGSVTITIAASL